MWMKSYTSKIFKNGGSQAVRLPHAVKFGPEVHEVQVRREGDRIILEPAQTWPVSFVRSLGGWDDDIPRPDQESLDDLRMLDTNL